jgi:hypothetical protein
MIAAGVNAKSLPEFMGHASGTITPNRFGHPMRGSETELDSYLSVAGARTGAGQPDAGPIWL